MAAATRAPKGNRLLQALPAKELGLLRPHLAHGSFKVHQGFERANKQIEEVWFPESGILSVVAEHAGGSAEIGIIGCEGMSGTAVILGSDRSPHVTYVQLAGDGHRLPAAKLREAMARSQSLHRLLMKFVQAFLVQTAHTAIANARATLVERLARWLLMAHDRVPGQQLVLTHEFLSVMLAVRRAGVTEALHDLEGRKLIAVGRREITLRDRSGIEKIAGEFYGTPEGEYRRLFK